MSTRSKRRAAGRRLPARRTGVRSALRFARWWSSLRELAPRMNRAAWVALLLGVVVSMTIVGVSARFAASFEAWPAARGAVCAGVLGALALGLRVPQQFAAWVCAMAWQRFLRRGQGGMTPSAFVGAWGTDHPLRWVVLAVVALVVGVTTALLPVILAVAVAGYGWFARNFVWTPAPEAILQASIVFCAALLPAGMLGLALGMTHRLAGARAQWSGAASGWSVMGAGLGLAGGVQLETWFHQPNLTLMAAALPALAVSLICILSEAAGRTRAVDEVLPEVVTPPAARDRWPALLGAGIVVVALGGALAATVWHYVLQVQAAEATGVAAVLLLGLGLGAVLGSQPRPAETCSIGGFGLLSAGAGLAVGAAAALGQYLGRDSLGVTLACMFAGLLLVGATAARGQQVALCRVANRVALGTRTLGRVTVAGALAVWLIGPLCAHVLGVSGASALVALSLLALGGILIVHEPDYTVRARRVQLWAVLISVAVVTVLLRYAPRIPV